MSDGEEYTVSKQLIMASFSLGYMLSAVPGGRAAERLGGKDVMLCAMLTWCAWCARCARTRTRAAAFVSVLGRLGVGCSSASFCFSRRRLARRVAGAFSFRDDRATAACRRFVIVVIT